MALKKVFVSFDYENDKQYKYLLEAWDANPQFDFEFNDGTPTEINSFNIGRIRAGLTTHTLVIVGKEANKTHKNTQLIGHRNWINFEIYQGKLYGKKLAAVKLSPLYELPEEPVYANVSWAQSFIEDAIIRALDNA
jgi:hypothetical protein